ncbi:DUF4352 domain-containing protein [Streptomyces sp. C10-9-1]|uniref:DUF4352 domain-containing protein n=1 Tax=Streptomyces sp. C10-9-1 TaxID=1859285 RepID=UPI002111ADBB|nr:DUF4352 domain-containing protein [Streptomyces sp. C10-9-1]MCQ6555439.1 DUF4352 domain-containing protein [Streptomyces sp. C10-9-1]
MIPPKPTDEPTFFTAPVAAPAGGQLSWRAAVLLAAWTVVVAGVSSAVTVAIVGTAAPTSSPSIWQDSRTYPDDAAEGPEEQPSPSPTSKSYAMGEKAKSGGATVVVKKVGEAASVTLDDFDSEKILKAGTGAKFAIVETTVYNDGTEPFDPVCGGGISQGLIDAEGRKFDIIHEVFQVKANRKADACGEEVQPGFKRDAVFVYKLPADASPAQWSFSGSRGMTEGDLAVVTIAGSASS